MPTVLKEDYGTEISKKLSLGHALRLSLWIFALIACILGMAIAGIGGGAAYFAIGTLASTAATPLESGQAAILELADVVGELRSDDDYLSVAENMSGSLGDMASAIEGISDSVSSLQSIPFIGGQFSGLSGAKMEASARKMRMAAESVENIATNMDGALDDLDKVESELRTAGLSVGNAKKSIIGAGFMMQTAVGALTLALECMFTGCLAIALCYGPPRKNSYYQP